MSKRTLHSEGRKKIAALFVLVCLLCFLGHSWQEAGEEVLDVKPYLSLDGVHAGETIDVAFVLDITPGWHINGPEQEDEFMISCSLSIEEDEAFEVVDIYYPVPEKRSYSYSEAELQVYEGKVVLGARVKVKDATQEGKYNLKAKFSYQACNDVSCMPPEALGLEIPFQVVPAMSVTKKLNQEIFEHIKFR
jgi:thiol:disulfide interchange protein DsbD